MLQAQQLRKISHHFQKKNFRVFILVINELVLKNITFISHSYHDNFL